MPDQVQNPGTVGVSTRLDRADWLSFAVTALLALSGYLLTLTPEVTLEDSGTLTTGAMYGGVGFPAGYPVWTIYSWLFIKLLPIHNPAWRVAVGSAVAGAMSCGLVALIVSRGGKILFNGKSAIELLSAREQNLIRGVSGYVAGMALGFSDGLWYEAVVPDFVTFTLLFFTVIIYLLMRWMETGRRRICWLAFFVYGLLLTNSQEMVIALPGIACAIMLIDRKLGRDISLIVLPISALATSVTQYGIWNSFRGVIVWPLLVAFAIPFLLAVGMAAVTRRVGSEWKSALACALFLLLGLATYLYLPIIATTNPPVNWAYSRTWGGFLHLISRGQYEGIHPVSSIAAFASQLWALIKQTVNQLGWLYTIFAVLPFFFLRRMTTVGRQWMCILILIAACVGPLLAALLNTPNDHQSQELVEIYFFPLRVLIALWTGAGLILFATTIATPRPDKSPIPA